MIRNRVAWGVRFIVIESFNYKIIGLYREKLLESQFAFRLACLWKMRKMFNSSSFFTSLASHAILVVNCPNGHHRDAKCGLEYSWRPTLAPSALLCLFVLWQPQPLQVLESSQTVKAITRLLRFHGGSVCLSVLRHLRMYWIRCGGLSPFSLSLSPSFSITLLFIIIVPVRYSSFCSVQQWPSRTNLHRCATQYQSSQLFIPRAQAMNGIEYLASLSPFASYYDRIGEFGITRSLSPIYATHR